MDNSIFMKEEYFKWYSRYLSRDFEMLAFGEASGIPVILFPTAEGRYYDNKDNGLIDAVSYLLDRGLFRIYCPDGVDCDSFLNWDIHPADRVKTYLGYENLILYDVIDFALAQTGRKKVMLSGCSLGGYYATNIGFKHPDKVSAILCMAATYDIKQYVDGYYDDNCYFNSPVDYIPGLSDPWYLNRIKKMKIYMGVGDMDICHEENIHMSGILKSKGIPHCLEIYPGADHHWYWWKGMFPSFLERVLSK